MTKTYENALKEAFPEIDAGIQPFGSRVLVQIRTAKKKTARRKNTTASGPIAGIFII